MNNGLRLNLIDIYFSCIMYSYSNKYNNNIYNTCIRTYGRTYCLQTFLIQLTEGLRKRGNYLILNPSIWVHISSY